MILLLAQIKLYTCFSEDPPTRGRVFGAPRRVTASLAVEGLAVLPVLCPVLVGAEQLVSAGSAHA